MELAALQEQTRLLLRQKITVMVNQYTVHLAEPDGTPGPVVAFAEQKRLALKEQVTVYTDESRSRVLTGFKARTVVDFAGEYDVVDEAGKPIGKFWKRGMRSLLRSTWHLQQPGLPTLTGQERNPVVAVLRRFVDALSWLPYHFDFSIGASIAFSVDSRWGIRDTYLINVRDPRLDRRLVIAMAIALDALEGR
ncbi:hypothetical protein TBS_21940 [Thermobispora bispora]|jgi:hypothetical protein|uniref:Uncharacterized protein n=1 Tax=Thermobispora bispora (strain ATCC 19993 / DSM 43833 / CBS 139.67 / JCM 10125 / KCTC 9307 / NBRC 14880 / R51) TaxID=469371 RepID=D6Y442_THEBD|nr:hypothetical protein [Thermobispora bispora]MBO2475847.1 hypothetical protein [Actinomycetales bacterium]MDI9580474.1 hypothetical protein [Thermobispora sp.]ADG87096.1 hypothetical protein Tbis_0366 [Thermobispora bispora DSM 43833]MBX6166129.1 hypothetical protein [Thermobispora bispora]QSI47068.1 hypothetical protein CYL17_03760 [Thermobispora bispora]